MRRKNFLAKNISYDFETETEIYAESYQFVYEYRCRISFGYVLRQTTQLKSKRFELLAKTFAWIHIFNLMGARCDAEFGKFI